MRGCTAHGTEIIRCPFFRGHNSIEIACEGISPECRLRLLFRRKEEKDRHEAVFCADRFHYCELYDAIYKQYEEEDP